MRNPNTTAVNFTMMPRLVERMDTCCAARGLTRHDFIVYAVEREVTQVEARLARRAREAREVGTPDSA